MAPTSDNIDGSPIMALTSDNIGGKQIRRQHQTTSADNQSWRQHQTTSADNQSWRQHHNNIRHYRRRTNGAIIGNIGGKPMGQASDKKTIRNAILARMDIQTIAESTFKKKDKATTLSSQFSVKIGGEAVQKISSGM
ncbi:hypothetical protein MAR_019295 [Mya arenaria]|uniref:Uncharacterized protein n=1 Tax=Mya arenaria TaxID=6604 RepID=A0ABY7EH68_MYAAR|nr:hypothetical protein MAR_019295 [Mya arenaria]